jgi:hypothetical protein
VVGCGKQGGKEIDLGNPPNGYRVATPFAALATLPGNLPMISEKPVFAERGGLLPFFRQKDDQQRVETPVLRLPPTTRFGLTANLRAGALIQKPFLRDPTNVLPINSYAQFVVKITAAMGPKTVMVASDEAIMPVKSDLVSKIVVNSSGWIWALLAGIAVVGVVLSLVFIPGFRLFVSAVFGFFAALINRLAKLIEGRRP